MALFDVVRLDPPAESCDLFLSQVQLSVNNSSSSSKQRSELLLQTVQLTVYINNLSSIICFSYYL